MNNVNGKELLARVKPGDLVTVRTHDGAILTGRAEIRPTGLLYLRSSALFGSFVTESNIIAVESRD